MSTHCARIAPWYCAGDLVQHALGQSPDLRADRTVSTMRHPSTAAMPRRSCRTRRRSPAGGASGSAHHGPRSRGSRPGRSRTLHDHLVARLERSTRCRRRAVGEEHLECCGLRGLTRIGTRLRSGVGTRIRTGVSSGIRTGVSSGIGSRVGARVGRNGAEHRIPLPGRDGDVAAAVDRGLVRIRVLLPDEHFVRLRAVQRAGRRVERERALPSRDRRHDERGVPAPAAEPGLRALHDEGRVGAFDLGQTADLHLHAHPPRFPRRRPRP